MSTRDILLAAQGAPSSSKVYVDDLFNAILYNGNGASRSITTGIDLTTDGGLVICKQRNSASADAFFLSTVRGTSGLRFTNTGSELGAGLSSYGASGFSLSSSSTLNTSGALYEAFTFKKAAKFYTQVAVSHTTGSNTNVDLSDLGVVGLVMAKLVSATAAWWVWHSGLTAGNNLRNTSAGQSTTTPYLSVSGTTLTIASGQATGTYMIYAWAHDSSDDGAVQCGLYTGNGSATGPVVTLGWEPQFLLIKRINTTGSWALLDSARGIPVVGNQPFTAAESVAAENITNRYLNLLADGFQLSSTATVVNESGGKYVYMAVRRSNKPPASGADVFSATVYTGTNADNRLIDTTIAPDMVMLRRRGGSGAGYEGFLVGDRLRGQEWVKTESSGPVATVTADGLDQQIASTEFGTAFSASNGVYVGNATGTVNTSPNINASTTANDHIALAFKRAAKFFDSVCYTGDATGPRDIKHSLGVMPEMVMIRRRDSLAMNWIVWHKALASVNHQLTFDTVSAAAGPFTGEISDISATAITLGSGSPNASAGTFIAHMFATLAGVSKVGSYVGNGTSQTIDCGFSTGARFVLIRNISGGSWLVFDTARGIVSGNDPYLITNSTAAEVSTADTLDPDNTGFIVNQVAGPSINTSGATYAFLAIA